MRTLLIAIGLLQLMVTLQSHAQPTFGGGNTVVFATVEEARTVLTNRDDYVERLSPFDRAAKLKTDRDVSEAEYLAAIAKNVLEWTDEEKQKISSAVEHIRNSLDTLSLPLPKKVLFIKTTGKDEGAAAYTRSNAIILPKRELVNSAGKNRKLICHELFHILSRENPALREKLYALIGFVKCDEVPFPVELKSRKITNPDAPRNDHCIRLQVDGKERWAVPILFSRAEKYDVQMGGEFFLYLEFRFLLVERKEGTSAVTPVLEGGKAALAGLDSVSGYMEQIGMNTEYIIHPEEILADNFALMVLRNREVASPSILKRLEQALKEK